MSRVRPALTRIFHGFLRRAPMGEDGMARIAARQIYILPTPNGLLYASSAFAMLVGSLNYQNNLGLLIAFFLTAVGLLAMHHCWYNLLGLAITVRPGPAVFAGTAAQFEVTLRNERAGARYDLRVTGGLDPAKSVFLDAGDQQVVAFGLAARRRGLLRLAQVEVATRHPMHLFRAWCYAQSEACCLVYPRPAPTAPPPVSAAGDARRPAQRGGEGVDDYLGSRAYRIGDSPRRLDWKVLARERGLVVKEFGGEEGLEVWIDWANLAAPDLEGRISLLTRQCLDAAQSSLRFGLRLPGVELGLATGEAHLQRCLRELALYGDGPRRP
ncbi:MAG TPA: DUF58 domain-containing protein [Lamprocystis sp. (in: g-proteobacteria)]|nr:DUF58 domain-containing protein [Lamprocystis sp. (in: g-proteobacteria)]